ncbi:MULTISPECIES: hypothetical protein [unclassified Actinomyces]|uniref:hypothetical protein n=1 Tax=unclassified Actinomyces TaxID=2609248 RepID=UPI0020176690|nr:MULTISPECIES: hypothetical protein [unclassified Actinomyces]MCL3777619.1 hypothetical protein [Actinomyces sp. AC-20-1]MCL3789439.1 hypothetical protein [Actinomyces sp. 187325]MCL3794425.1 hypothetical protein [Actinomyces sp. 217892]
MHGQFGDKRDPVMSRCAEVIASHGDHLIAFDLPAHGERRDGTAFSAAAASREVKELARIAHSQSTEVGLLAIGIGAYVSLCDAPPGTFQHAWLVSSLIDLERYVRDVMVEYSVTDEPRSRPAHLHSDGSPMCRQQVIRRRSCDPCARVGGLTPTRWWRAAWR